MKKITDLCQYAKYYFSGSNKVRALGDGIIKVDKTAVLKNTEIYVYPGASLSIECECQISDSVIYVGKGNLTLSEFTIVERSKIMVDDGSAYIDNHCKIAAKRVWVRFGGILNIGCYTNINSLSEIRCDELIKIGSYNQISYGVRIWDTNTHSVLSSDKRRRVTEEKFPYFGFESSKPATRPIYIGNDCWIGENVAILKGTNIKDGCIVGYGTLLAGTEVPPNSRVVEKRTHTICPIKLSTVQ